MSTAQLVPEQESIFSSNWMDKGICLVIEKSWIGVSKAVNSSRVEVKADKDMIHVSKQLFDCPELKKILSSDTKVVDEYVRQQCLPGSSLFRRGAYLLPIDLFANVDAKLVEHAENRKKLVEDFCKVYENAVANAKERLQDLFDPFDYPPVEVVRESFTFSWRYLQFGVDPKLEAISKSIYQREQEKAQVMWNEAGEEIRHLLRLNMQELVSSMVDKLAPTVEGEKKKVFKKTSLNKINEFFETFDARNLTGDEELKKLVEDAKKLAEGITPEVLKSSEELKENLRTGFESIKQSLDQMLIDAPARRFRFEE